MQLTVNNDKAKCAGQATDGTQQCAYRENCGRFQRPAGDRQVWQEYWRGGDDCPQYEIISRG